MLGQIQYSKKKKFSFSCSYLLLLLQQFLNQHHLPLTDSPPYFQILSTLCTFGDTAFPYWPCSYMLSSQVLMTTSSSSLHHQQSHLVHLPRTMMSGQSPGVSRLAKSTECEAALPFLSHIICDLLIFIQEVLSHSSLPFLFLIHFSK